MVFWYTEFLHPSSAVAIGEFVDKESLCISGKHVCLETVGHVCIPTSVSWMMLSNTSDLTQ